MAKPSAPPSSGSDGVYSFADLPPGAWSLTLDATGYEQVALPALEVLASKATRHDVVMKRSRRRARPGRGSGTRCRGRRADSLGTRGPAGA